MLFGLGIVGWYSWIALLFVLWSNIKQMVGLMTKRWNTRILIVCVVHIPFCGCGTSWRLSGRKWSWMQDIVVVKVMNKAIKSQSAMANWTYYTQKSMLFKKFILVN